MALGQLKITPDGQLKDKLEMAIDRLKAFEPEEGYFVAFSGGKDSQCIYHLCEMAGVKFDAHYSLTSVDPPELVYFIRDQYSTVSVDILNSDTVTDAMNRVIYNAVKGAIVRAREGYNNGRNY